MLYCMKWTCFEADIDGQWNLQWFKGAWNTQIMKFKLKTTRNLYFFNWFNVNFKTVSYRDVVIVDVDMAICFDTLLRRYEECPQNRSLWKTDSYEEPKIHFFPEFPHLYLSLCFLKIPTDFFAPSRDRCSEVPLYAFLNVLRFSAAPLN